MQGTECYVNLQTSVVTTEQNNVMSKGEELIGTIGYLTLYVRWQIKRCLYNWVDCTFILKINIERLD
jgi:hypothetical protein